MSNHKNYTWSSRRPLSWLWSLWRQWHAPVVVNVPWLVAMVEEEVVVLVVAVCISMNIVASAITVKRFVSRYGNRRDPKT